MNRIATFALTALTALALPAAASAQTCPDVEAGIERIDVTHGFAAWAALTEQYDVPESDEEEAFFSAADAAVYEDAGSTYLVVEEFYAAAKENGVRGAEAMAELSRFPAKVADAMDAARGDAKADYDAIADELDALVADYREVLAAMGDEQQELTRVRRKIAEVLSGELSIKGSAEDLLERLKEQEQRAEDKLAALADERDALRAEAQALHADRQAARAEAATYAAGGKVFGTIACAIQADLAAEGDAAPRKR